MIEKATLDDREAIFSLHVDSVTALCASHYNKTQIENWFVGRSPADYDGAIAYGGVWIARRTDIPLGFVELFPGVISMLFIHPAAAGQGIGTRLMIFALEQARRGGASTIKLEATKNAERFYHRFGFHSVGESRLERGSGIALETVLMEQGFS